MRDKVINYLINGIFIFLFFGLIAGCCGCMTYIASQGNIERQKQSELKKAKDELLNEKIDNILTDKKVVDRIYRSNRTITIIFFDGTRLDINSRSHHSAGSHLEIE